MSDLHTTSQAVQRVEDYLAALNATLSAADEFGVIFQIRDPYGDTMKWIDLCRLDGRIVTVRKDA